jgi:hypothetical protein
VAEDTLFQFAVNHVEALLVAAVATGGFTRLTDFVATVEPPLNRMIVPVEEDVPQVTVTDR